MLGVILTTLIAIIVVVILIASKMPDNFRYTRALLINAPAEKIFPHINNLHKFNIWNPWAKIDPSSKSTFTGPEEGIGAALSWDGNNKVGSGSMTCTQSRPFDFIQFRMDFIKPMQAVNIVEFILVEQNGQTTVNWTMYGQTTLMGKIINLLINCEKMVGEQYDKGLINLKQVVESK